MFEQKKPDTYKKSFCIGRIAKRSDLLTGTDGRQYVKFSVAVNQNKEKADFFDYIAYNINARYVDRHIHKGIKVIVAGTDTTGNYTDKKGQKHKTQTSICLFCYPTESTEGQNIMRMVNDSFLCFDGGN